MRIAPRGYSRIISTSVLAVLLTPLVGAQPAPQLVGAVLQDFDDSGQAEPGEILTLVFDQGVIVNTPLINDASFLLPVGGDSLGASILAEPNPINPRHMDVRLGPGVSLTIPGEFGVAPSASGIALDPGINPLAIQSLYGVPAQPGPPVDILFALESSPPTLIGPAGGSVSVVDSPDANYTQHTLDIPAGALPTDVTFTLRPPPDRVGPLQAAQLTAGEPGLTFAIPASVTLEYRESDVTTDLGDIEIGMRIHQLVENPPGVFTPVLVSGSQVLDVDANTVTALISSPNPQGGSAPAPSGVIRQPASGEVGTLATLPVNPVDDRTIYIAPNGGGAAAASPGRQPPGVTLTPGPDGLYTAHRIEFPGYQLTSQGASGSFAVTIKTATVFERVDQGTGTSFPGVSGAVCAVETRDENGILTAFSDTVNLRVEFKATDVVTLGGLSAVPEGMRLVQDAVDGATVDFQFVSGVTTTVSTNGLNWIEATGVSGLTGASGQGTWGTAFDPSAMTPVVHWTLYR